MKSKFLTIYIPTFGRAGKQITYHNLSPKIQDLTYLVIHPSEKHLYKDYKTIICKEDKIAKKRKWIVENCKSKYLIMMDDDLQFYVRKKEDDWHLRYCDKGKDINKMVKNLLILLKCGYHHVGLSDRSGNNHIKDLLELNTRMFGVLGYNTKIIREEVEFGRVNLHEDYDITLQMLYKGYPNAVLYQFAKHDIGGYNSEGGCSTERTLEIQNNSVKQFCDLHKGFAVPRQMKKKSQEGEMATRMEMIVYWKKAFKSSQKEKDI